MTFTVKENQTITNLSNSKDGEVLRDIFEKYILLLADSRTYGQLTGDDMQNIEITYRSREQARSCLLYTSPSPRD